MLKQYMQSLVNSSPLRGGKIKLNKNYFTQSCLLFSNRAIHAAHASIKSICLYLVLAATLLAASHPANAAISDEKIQDAIVEIQNYLFSQQKPDGTWEGTYTGQHVGGETALVTYALLTSGISPQDERLVKTINYLVNVDMKGTYAISLRSHCFAAMSASYSSKLARDAQWLISAQKNGTFTYMQTNQSGFDHSNTQYGLLGLWEYAKRGGGASPTLWRNVIDHFTSAQNEDGGWGYTPNSNSTDSMTAAGLTSLLIAQECLHKTKDTPDTELQEIINRGMIWLDTRARNNRGLVGGSKMYDLYSVERVGMAGGIKMVGGRDWFEAGAEYIVARLSDQGSLGASSGTAGGTVVNTSFALLFLARGRVPVWASKLQLNSQEWNNRPNDLHLFTRRLSKRREQEQNWQVVNIASDPFYWLNAPVAYVSSRGEAKLTEEEQANLKAYLQMGGLLVINPEGNEPEFAQSMRLTVMEMFPRAKWYDIQPDHPMLSLIHLIKLPKKTRIKVLSNGVRDIAIMLPKDWGLMLQRGQSETSYKPDLIMMNLYAMVSDRGRLEHRFSTPLISRKRGESSRDLMVVRARYKGNWGQEPLWLHAVGSIMHNRSNINVVRGNEFLNQIDSHPNTLVHLSGSGSMTLMPDELASIQKFIEAGGTMLVETIGGRGNFSINVQDQLSIFLQQPVIRIPSSHPIIAGKVNNGFDLSQCEYRHYSMANMNLRETPRLAAIYHNDRPAIIFSHEDLTLGALGVQHWGVNGYTIDDSRKIWCNLLLYVNRSLSLSGKPAASVPKGKAIPVIPEGIAELITDN